MSQHCVVQLLKLQLHSATKANGSLPIRLKLTEECLVIWHPLWAFCVSGCDDSLPISDLFWVSRRIGVGNLLSRSLGDLA